MAFLPKQTSLLLCLVLVITSIAITPTYVNATAQQFESKTLSGCPITQDDHAQVRSNLLQELGTMIEKLSEETIQPPTTEQTTEESTALPTPEQTTEESMSTTTDLLYTCNGTPGWRRVVFMNMTDTSYNCPPGLSLTSYSKRTCGRLDDTACHSTTFSVGGSEYSRVCGRIRGYQVGLTSGFFSFLYYNGSLERSYIDGVSLTHRNRDTLRTHIWSFAAGAAEIDGRLLSQVFCPCDTTSETTISPPFVGNDYFCESGVGVSWPGPSVYGMLFPDDPLWDGQGCASTSTCCQFNNPPWFTKNLPNPTTDDIELRVCLSSIKSVNDVALELIDLYVQ